MVNYQERPFTTVILAMTADGKISDYMRSPAAFGSQQDKAHLETQVALADAVLFGAGTLRAYGTTLSVKNPQLLQQRQQQHLSPQPTQIVVSASGKLSSQLRFFAQPVPRWLITTAEGARAWSDRQQFERILVADCQSASFSWYKIFQKLKQLGIDRLAILGGGELIASLLTEDLIDRLWLTVCPFLFGGKNAPTPVEGAGFLATQAANLQLVSVEQSEQEVFLQYLVRHSSSKLDNP